MKLSTNSQIKQAIKRVMGDQKARENEEIRRLLAEKEGLVQGEDYNADHFSSAVGSLYRSGVLVRVSRGCYQMAEAGETSENVRTSEAGVTSENVKTLENAKTDDPSEADAWRRLEEVCREIRISLTEERKWMEQKLDELPAPAWSQLSSDYLDEVSRLMEIKEGLEKLIKKLE